MTLLEHSTQQEQNIYSFQAPMEHSSQRTLGHKTNSDKFKRMKIRQKISSDHNRKKQEISKRKSVHTWKLHNSLLNNQWVKEKS